MWGPDAMEFRPERWLESPGEKTETPLGVYGNLCVSFLLNWADEETHLICLSMLGSLSPQACGAVSAGGLRKPAVFPFNHTDWSAHSATHRSLAEIQAFLVTLVREFDFSIPEGRNIRTARPGILVPIVIGEEDKGPQLPLKITPVRDI